MNIHKIVSEVINGVKRDFVMIDFEEYNNYMLHIAYSNKKLIDDETINKKREQQQKKEEVELKRINDIKDRERREQEREEKYKASIDKEIQINKFHNEKVKKLKEELRDEYKEVFDTYKDAKIQKCDFCK
jgi:predicted GNAT superfamily acetyltransferase